MAATAAASASASASSWDHQAPDWWSVRLPGEKLVLNITQGVYFLHSVVNVRGAFVMTNYRVSFATQTRLEAEAERAAAERQRSALAPSLLSPQAAAAAAAAASSSSSSSSSQPPAERTVRWPRGVTSQHARVPLATIERVRVDQATGDAGGRPRGVLGLTTKDGRELRFGFADLEVARRAHQCLVPYAFCEPRYVFAFDYCQARRRQRRERRRRRLTKLSSASTRLSPPAAASPTTTTATTTMTATMALAAAGTGVGLATVAEAVPSPADSTPEAGEGPVRLALTIAPAPASSASSSSSSPSPAPQGAGLVVRLALAPTATTTAGPAMATTTRSAATEPAATLASLAVNVVPPPPPPPPPTTTTTTTTTDARSHTSEAETEAETDAGWSLYEPERDFQRMGVPNERWRLTRLNADFALCPTYPRLLCVPTLALVTDDDLRQSAAFRSKRRLPVMVWTHPSTHACLFRCSQPNAGLNSARSDADERLIEAFSLLNPLPPHLAHGSGGGGGGGGSSEWPGATGSARASASAPRTGGGRDDCDDGEAGDEGADEEGGGAGAIDRSHHITRIVGAGGGRVVIGGGGGSSSGARGVRGSSGGGGGPSEDDVRVRTIIFDARPKLNAYGNRFKGKGFESLEYYQACSLTFLNIENIHSMRTAYQKCRRVWSDASRAVTVSPLLESLLQRVRQAKADAARHERQAQQLGVTLGGHGGGGHGSGGGYGGGHAGGGGGSVMGGGSGAYGASSVAHSSSSSSSLASSLSSSSSSSSSSIADQANVTSLPALNDVPTTWNVTSVHQLKELHASQWLYHLSVLLQGTYNMVHDMDQRQMSAICHCSDGWDRTSQLASLVQLCLDPYYRTKRGFLELIDKDWLSFGHKFHERTGHCDANHGDSQRSPVFLQFCDCVHQLLHQFPGHFEFHSFFLVTLVHHLYSCRFGTFLMNSVKERVELRVYEDTASLWTYMLQPDHNACFDDPQFVCEAADNLTAHGGVIRRRVLYPGYLPRQLRWWTEYFAQYADHAPGPPAPFDGEHGEDEDDDDDEDDDHDAATAARAEEWWCGDGDGDDDSDGASDDVDEAAAGVGTTATAFATGTASSAAASAGLRRPAQSGARASVMSSRPVAGTQIVDRYVKQHLRPDVTARPTPLPSRATTAKTTATAATGTATATTGAGSAPAWV